MPALRFPAVCPLLFLFCLPLGAADALPASAPAVSDDDPSSGLSLENELARLRALPPCHIPLKGAPLGSAIRLLAETARMSYLAPPEGDLTERVTSDTTMNPFELLEVLGENYNFGIEYRRGLWRFYRINLNELVTKAYTLRFNNLEQVSIASSSINSQLAAFSGGSGGGSSPGGGASGPGAMSGGSGSSAAGGTFNAKTGKIIEDIKKILGIPTVGLDTPTLDGSPDTPNAAAARRGSEAPKIEPIWNPDTSQLFVVATRQQHSLVAAYLRTIDKPQKLIRIAVKFVETSRNPSSTVGVDWSQTFLGSGGPISLSGATISTTNTSVSNAGTTLSTATNAPPLLATGATGSGGSNSSGSFLPSTALSSAINLAHPGTIQLPIALLSAPAFQLTMQAIAQDQHSSVVQDPVLYTSNNREVTFKATTEQPIQEGSTTFGSATAATTSQIAYIEVGTDLTVLPSVLPGSGPKRQVVLLSLSINVSTIVGQQVINGNPYPVTSTRTYSYSVPIPSGQTLAIAGLEQRSRQTTDTKVPLLGDIPLLGFAFKSRNDQVVHTTLLAFITPEVMPDEAPDKGSGAADIPEFKHRVFEGSPTETLGQVKQSLAGMAADIAALCRSAQPENRDAVLNRFDRLDVELALIDVRLGELRLAGDRVVALETAAADRVRGQLDGARAQVAKISVD